MAPDTMPSSTSVTRNPELLEILNKVLLRNRGAVYEGDIFSILACSPFVARSFEFSLADGCIDCTREFEVGVSFGDRFWEILKTSRDRSEQPSDLLFFDAKSKISGIAGDEIYLTTYAQRGFVAFFIGICAVDTQFVELIPNLHQGKQYSLAAKTRYVAVNTSRVSKLHATTYGLDPSNAPYRMPAYLLPEAIFRVRQCARGRGCYVNPWTLVSFPDWRPKTIASVGSLMPAEDTEHYSSCLAALEIQRIVKTQPTTTPFAIDFVNLQPRLADFKLIKNPTAIDAQQYFIQHKLDVRERAMKTKMNKVHIARSTGKGKISYFFTAFERFDFLFYQFTKIFPVPGGMPVTECFFIPESAIPDEFYTTTEIEADFDIDVLQEYRMRMDREGRWMHRVIEIVEQHPQPRRAMRPRRAVGADDPPAIVAQSAESLDDTSLVGAVNATNGRALYSDIMGSGQRQFFAEITMRCAIRGSGLLVVLSNQHPVADFVYCRYKWSTQDQIEFSQHGKLPLTLSDLTGAKPVLPICYHVRDLECTYQGPEVSSSTFRRLNSCRHDRLLVWNLTGPDDLHRPAPLTVIPSEDLCPTMSQRVKLSKNLNINKKETHAERTPSLSSMLRSGLYASEYRVQSLGPLAYQKQETHWDALWALFDRFTKAESLEHPKGRVRDPKAYMQPLWMLHERLVQEDYRDLSSSAPATKRKRSPES